MNRQDMQKHTILELFDISFRIYRKNIVAYIQTVALLFIFLSPFMLLILSSYTLNPIEWTFKTLILGTLAVASTNPVGVIFREVIFPDGIFIWSIAAITLAPITIRPHNLPTKEYQHLRHLQHLKPWILILSMSTPVIILRIIGAGPIADLARIPTLLTPYILALENLSLAQTFYQNLILIRHSFPRVILSLLVSLFAVRFVMFLPFLIPFMFNKWQLYLPTIEIDTFNKLIPFLALSAELLIYPAIHIALALIYRDLRIRHDGVDMTLATTDSTENSGHLSS